MMRPSTSARATASSLRNRFSTAASRALRGPARASIALASSAALLLTALPARAQVSDSERAAARELFKQGDELQRAGHFADALDKFQRAQQVYAAPTNQLRIAECEAALGHLVESAEAFRSVARTTLAPGSPPAFQSAIDQAKAELEQVDPRVPRVVVQVSPPSLQAPQLQIDGQSVPAALLDAPIPLDPGTHRVLVSARGYAAAEQGVTLRERDSRTLTFVLRALPAPPPPPPPVAGAAPPAPPPSSPSGVVVVAPPPPPPPPQPLPPPPRVSRLGIFVGGHLGGSAIGGDVPIAGGGSIPLADVANGGAALGLDFGFRFGRRWILGATLEHDFYESGDAAHLANDGYPTTFDTNGASLVPDHTRTGSTLLEANIGLVGNPDRVAFYGDFGVGARWFWYNVYDAQGRYISGNSSSGLEFSLALGVWIPIGPSFRLLPKVMLDLGTYEDAQPDAYGNTNSVVHVAVMGGITAAYNLNF